MAGTHTALAELLRTVVRVPVQEDKCTSKRRRGVAIALNMELGVQVCMITGWVRVKLCAGRLEKPIAYNNGMCSRSGEHRCWYPKKSEPGSLDWKLILVLFPGRNYGFRRSHKSGMVVRHQEISCYFSEIVRIRCRGNQEE